MYTYTPWLGNHLHTGPQATSQAEESTTSNLFIPPESRQRAHYSCQNSLSQVPNRPSLADKKPHYPHRVIDKGMSYPKRMLYLRTDRVFPFVDHTKRCVPSLELNCLSGSAGRLFDIQLRYRPTSYNYVNSFPPILTYYLINMPSRAAMKHI